MISKNIKSQITPNMFHQINNNVNQNIANMMTITHIASTHGIASTHINFISKTYNIMHGVLVNIQPIKQAIINELQQ